MKRTLIGLALSGGIASAIVPIVALVTLMPADYGAFAVLYLVYALGNSILLSVVCDPWIRRLRQDSGSWASYAATTAAVAVIAGLVILAIGSGFALMSDEIVFVAVATSVMLWRNATRFRRLAEGRHSTVLLADVVGIVAFAVVFVVSWFVSNPAVAIALAWAALSVGASWGLGLPRYRRGDGVGTWVRRYRGDIGPLLGESLLMDAGAIGAPMIVAPVLGIAPFATYRAVSNVALPVRLILDPIRPVIAGRGIAEWLRVRSLAVIALLTVVLGFGAYAVLAWLLPLLPFTLGTLNSLTPFALPTGLFVSASFVGHFFYIAVRGNSKPTPIVVARIWQTALSLVLPVVGALTGGLLYAIWGFTLATIASSVAWVITALLARPRA